MQLYRSDDWNLLKQWYWRNMQFAWQLQDIDVSENPTTPKSNYEYIQVYASCINSTRRNQISGKTCNISLRGNIAIGQSIITNTNKLRLHDKWQVVAAVVEGYRKNFEAGRNAIFLEYSQVLPTKKVQLIGILINYIHTWGFHNLALSK